MENQEVWNSLEIIKILVSVLTPITIAIIGYLFSRRLKRVENEKIRQNKLREEEQQIERDEIERRHYPHIEFLIDCEIFGPQKGFFIVEFEIQAKNVSLIRHQFNKIDLRVRGIKKDEIPSLWDNHGERLEFTHKIFETDMVPKGWYYIFVEPGVTQRINYASRIPEDFAFISAWAKFDYDKYDSHTIEKMFEIKSCCK